MKGIKHSKQAIRNVVGAYMNGYSIVEIANIFSLSEDGVKSILYKRPEINQFKKKLYSRKDVQARLNEFLYK